MTRRRWRQMRPRSSDGKGVPLPGHLEQLWREADTIWSENQNRKSYGLYVAADYGTVYQMLRQLRRRAVTFLEWGSGLGVVTIMAASLGYDAYGIELEPELITRSRELAERYCPRAKFVQGNFIPSDYDWDSRCCDNDFRTSLEGPDAYRAMDMELRDFDLIYAFPWPDESEMFHDIVAQCSRNSMMLTYQHREGLRLCRLVASGK